LICQITTVIDGGVFCIGGVGTFVDFEPNEGRNSIASIFKPASFLVIHRLSSSC